VRFQTECKVRVGQRAAPTSNRQVSVAVGELPVRFPELLDLLCKTRGASGIGQHHSGQ
jgi:hypothetical protein